jgi:hypothetical protein
MKTFIVILTGVAITLVTMVLSVASAAEPEEITIVTKK